MLFFFSNFHKCITLYNSRWIQKTYFKETNLRNNYKKNVIVHYAFFYLLLVGTF